MGAVALQFAGNYVFGDDAAGFSVHGYHVHHFVAVVHFNPTVGNLARKCAVGTQEELLAGLTFGVERAAYLHTTEGAVVQLAAVVACKGNALGHALVYDAGGHLRQAVYVGFPAAVVASFDGVVKQTEHGVAVVLVVFGCVDATLRRNGVRTTGGILKAEGFHVVAQFCERSGGGAAGQARPYHNDVDASFVGGADQRHVAFVLGPLVGNGAFGNACVQFHGVRRPKS